MLVLSSISGAFCGCGAAKAQSQGDALQQSIASIQQRLAGTWVLKRFTPEVPLEGSLQLLLQIQFGRLTLNVDGDTLVARGPGVETKRRIQIRSAFVDHFDAAVYDQFGVGYETSNDLKGDQLVVQIVSMPWRGQAELYRSGTTSSR